MFDIGFMELLIIGVVALIVVGPKDLPIMFHKLGNYVGKAKAMAREFQRSMDDAAKASGLDDIAKGLKEVDSVRKMTTPGVGGMKEAKKRFDDIVAARDSGVPLVDAADEDEAADDDASSLLDEEDGAADQAALADAVLTPKTEKNAKIAASKPKAAAKPKAATAKAAKPKPATKPKAAPKPKAAAKPKAKPKPKPATKAKSGTLGDTDK